MKKMKIFGRSTQRVRPVSPAQQDEMTIQEFFTPKMVLSHENYDKIIMCLHGNIVVEKNYSRPIISAMRLFNCIGENFRHNLSADWWMPYSLLKKLCEYMDVPYILYEEDSDTIYQRTKFRTVEKKKGIWKYPESLYKRRVFGSLNLSVFVKRNMLIGETLAYIETPSSFIMGVVLQKNGNEYFIAIETVNKEETAMVEQSTLQKRELESLYRKLYTDYFSRRFAEKNLYQLMKL